MVHVWNTCSPMVAFNCVQSFGRKSEIFSLSMHSINIKQLCLIISDVLRGCVENIFVKTRKKWDARHRQCWKETRNCRNKRTNYWCLEVKPFFKCKWICYYTKLIQISKNQKFKKSNSENFKIQEIPKLKDPKSKKY